MRATTETHTVTNTLTLHTTNQGSHYGGTRSEQEWWMVLDGTVVGYLKTSTDTTQPTILGLCDIEIRDGYRGQGHVSTMVNAVENLMGATLHTTGSFTPLGYAALAGRFPIQGNPDSVGSVNCDDMTFVQDWDTRTGMFPL